MKLQTNLKLTLFAALVTLTAATNIAAMQQLDQQPEATIKIAAETRKKVVLWDLGFVLMQPKQGKMSWYLLPQTAGVSLWNFNPWNIVRLVSLYKNGLLDQRKIQATGDLVMDQARPNQEKQTLVVNQYGIPVPNITFDYQSGKKTNKELLDEIQTSFKNIEEADKKKNAEDRVFQNPAHSFLVRKTIEMRYKDSKFYGESWRPIPAGISLIEKCKNAGTQMAVIANWDKESFPYLIANKDNNDLFKHFDASELFSTSTIQKVKPHREAFEHIAGALQVELNDMILVDDQIENVEAARKAGMEAIHLSDYTNPAAYEAVEAELQKLGAL